jgi:hypothetical protein
MTQTLYAHMNKRKKIVGLLMQLLTHGIFHLVQAAVSS